MPIFGQRAPYLRFANDNDFLKLMVFCATIPSINLNSNGNTMKRVGLGVAKVASFFMQLIAGSNIRLCRVRFLPD